MIDKHDNLGNFHIPDHLLRQAQSHAREIPTPDAVEEPENRLEAIIARYSPAWTVAKKIQGSNGSVHTVGVRRVGRAIGSGEEADFLQFRCSCQAFRIQKKGYCKHTVQVKEEIENGK